MLKINRDDLASYIKETNEMAKQVENLYFNYLTQEFEDPYYYMFISPDIKLFYKENNWGIDSKSVRTVVENTIKKNDNLIVVYVSNLDKNQLLLLAFQNKLLVNIVLMI